MIEDIEKYLGCVAKAAEQGTLVKMTLSKPVNKHDELRNIYVKPVLIKEKRLFAFSYRYERRDEVKNYDAEQMLMVLKELLPARFLNAVLFTVNEDVTLLVSIKARRRFRPKRCRNVGSRILNMTNKKPV